MKHIYIFLILSSFLFSQVKLSVSSVGKFDDKEINPNLSFSYDKVFFKQPNIKSGIGLEHMIKADSRDLSYTNLSSNSIYIFSRFIYEKKWASYLRLGITDLNSDQFTLNGSYIAFGADYKLSKKWYVESGYHMSIVDDKSYNKIIFSIIRHFDKKDD